MPNVSAQDLPITRAAAPVPGWPTCSAGACVEVKHQPGTGVELTSTIEGNDGLVSYTQDEWNVFGADVKAGRYDETFTA